MSSDAIRMAIQGQRDFATALLETYQASEKTVSQAKAYADALRSTQSEQKKLQGQLANSNSAVTLIQSSIKGFSTVVTGLNTAFAAIADLWYHNIDQLVNLYQAQINVISSQNTYTQGLALQSEATVLYGKNSEQAARATTAANYVGALYTQSKKNEVVAQEQYYTATATNLATISTSFMQMAQALGILQLAQTGMIAASIEGASALEVAAIPIVGALLAGGLTAYELLSQPSPTVSAPGKAGGGYVGRTGTYFLHQGETVDNSGITSASSSPNANVNIYATSNIDLARIRHEVNAAIAQTMLHASKQRGVY